MHRPGLSFGDIGPRTDPYLCNGQMRYGVAIKGTHALVGSRDGRGGMALDAGSFGHRRDVVCCIQRCCVGDGKVSSWTARVNKAPSWLEPCGTNSRTLRNINPGNSRVSTRELGWSLIIDGLYGHHRYWFFFFFFLFSSPLQLSATPSHYRLYNAA